MQKYPSAMLAVLAGVAFLAQLFVFLAAGVQAGDALLRAQTDVRLKIKDTASDQSVQEFLVAIHALKYTDEATLITKEQAYEQEKRVNPTFVSFIEQYNLQNPFPDTIAVRLNTLQNYDAFAEFIKQTQWQPVVDPGFLSSDTNQEQQVRELLTITQTASILAYVLVGIVVLVLIFVLAEIVRTRSIEREDEILVERYMGASDFPILMPFLVEVCVLLFFALVIGAIGIGVLALVLPVLIPSLSYGGVFYELHETTKNVLVLWSPFLLGFELLAIPVLAYMGAVMIMET
jgi:cell division protein FtsX